jgi:glutaredoxin-related protein
MLFMKVSACREREVACASRARLPHGLSLYFTPLSQGSPDEPECGFSRRMVELMRAEGVPDFGYFNILADPAVREGLKILHSWPTYPQLCVDGALVGGLDVITAMKVRLWGSGRHALAVAQLPLPPPAHSTYAGALPLRSQEEGGEPLRAQLGLPPLAAK